MILLIEAGFIIERICRFVKVTSAEFSLKFIKLPCYAETSKLFIHLFLIMFFLFLKIIKFLNRNKFNTNLTLKKYKGTLRIWLRKNYFQK